MNSFQPHPLSSDDAEFNLMLLMDDIKNMGEVATMEEVQKLQTPFGAEKSRCSINNKYG